MSRSGQKLVTFDDDVLNFSPLELIFFIYLNGTKRKDTLSNKKKPFSILLMLINLNFFLFPGIKQVKKM